MIPSTINHHSFQEYRGLLIFKHHNKQTTPRLPTILGVILYHYSRKGIRTLIKFLSGLLRGKMPAAMYVCTPCNTSKHCVLKQHG